MQGVKRTDRQRLSHTQGVVPVPHYSSLSCSSHRLFSAQPLLWSASRLHPLLKLNSGMSQYAASQRHSTRICVADCKFFACMLSTVATVFHSPYGNTRSPTLQFLSVSEAMGKTNTLCPLHREKKSPLVR